MRVRSASARAAVAVTAAVLAATTGLLGPVPAAGAHDPLVVGTDEAQPVRPLIADGTVSFATYGLIDAPGGSSTVRLQFAEGDELHLQLLVPDRPPENSRSAFGDLSVTVIPPSGEGFGFVADRVLEEFSEPFTSTDYLVLLEHSEPAAAGITEITVSSDAPTRFVLATGRDERFGTEVLDHERLPVSAVSDWYDTPPGSSGGTGPAAPPDGQVSTTTATPTSPAELPPTTAAGDDEPSGADTTEEVAVADSDGRSSAVPILVGLAVMLAVAVGVGMVLRRRDHGAVAGDD